MIISLGTLSNGPFHPNNKTPVNMPANVIPSSAASNIAT
jgi:hypothetical protein